MFGVETSDEARHGPAMVGADELLAALRERGVKNADIARVLDLPSSRVAEMYTGKRRLQLDEAKRLVEHYGIEDRLNPVSVPVARLLVLYVADGLGLKLPPEDPRVEELALTVRAFSEFAADPQVRESAEAAVGFLRGVAASRR
ncbi:MAG TPA: hypothetical protein VD768_08740 [Sphingomicrobium sp.]|nr:hypothetical protein [Sphingomicrobium sp.]